MINIDELIKNATLSQDKVALNAYKNIKSEFERFIHSGSMLPKRLTDEVQTYLIFDYSKKLKDSIRQFSEANRQDLVDEYTSELEVLQKLLPESANESEIEHHLYNWADELNFYSGEILEDRMEIAIPKKEMGNAIKFLKQKFPINDGQIIANIVKKYVK